MDIFRKLNSQDCDMALRMIRAAMQEASSIALLGLAAMIAGELAQRSKQSLKEKLQSLLHVRSKN